MDYIYLYDWDIEILFEDVFCVDDILNKFKRKYTANKQKITRN